MKRTIEDKPPTNGLKMNQAIREIPPVAPTKEMVGSIIKTAAAAYGIDVKTMLSRNRRQHVSDARTAAAYVMLRMGLSPGLVGDYLKRNRSTAVACKERGDALLATEKRFGAVIDYIIEKITD